jgi:hypothetical protein
VHLEKGEKLLQQTFAGKLEGRDGALEALEKSVAVCTPSINPDDKHAALDR